MPSLWWPSALLAARLAAACFMPIADCDETFNYLEPVHYIHFGNGLQTWEYSPNYALRSYLYLALYTPVLHLAKLISKDKLFAFYLLRCSIAAFSAACEYRLLKSVRIAFGDSVYWCASLFFVFNTGMAHASIAFLPSSFAMSMLMLGWSHWIHGMVEASKRSYSVAVGCVGFAVLLGWPFAALAGAILAIESMWTIGCLFFLRLVLGWGVMLTLPIILVDSYFYGRVVCAPLNIFLYNFSVSHDGGSQLYGVEPASYYVRNLLLNFNLLFAAAAIWPVICIMRPSHRTNKEKYGDGALARGKRVLLVLAAHAWIFFFSAIPHKEERFLYPIYPLVLIAAAAFFVDILPCFYRLLPWARVIINYLCTFIKAISVCLSVSRIAAMVLYYRAPIQVYGTLSRQLAVTDKPQTVCVGKEWYRFPSSFFLPSEDKRIGFIRSGFRGLLPSPFLYPAPQGTRFAPLHFNDENREEASQYTSIDECDWVVELMEGAEDWKRWGGPTWSLWHSSPFLSSSETDTFSRVLWIPLISRPVWAKYAVFRKSERP